MAVAKRKRTSPGDPHYQRLPLVYPACRGYPRGHDKVTCVHCQNFIRTHGPELQQVIRFANRLLDHLERLEVKIDKQAEEAASERVISGYNRVARRPGAPGSQSRAV